MSAEKITAEKRTEFGKGAARRVRRENKIPAVLYELGQEATHLTLPGHVTMMALRNGGANALLDIDLDGESQLALVKDVQVDPIRRQIEHLDLYAVKRGEKVVVEVPVEVVGQAGPDTLVVTDATTIQIEVDALNVPESIEVSVQGAPAGTLIHAGDLTLPEGATLVDEADLLLVNISVPVTQVEETTEDEDGDEETAGE